MSLQVSVSERNGARMNQVFTWRRSAASKQLKQSVSRRAPATGVAEGRDVMPQTDFSPTPGLCYLLRPCRSRLSCLQPISERIELVSFKQS